MDNTTTYLLAFQKLGLGAVTLRRLRETIPDLRELWHANAEQLTATGISASFIGSFIRDRSQLDPESYAAFFSHTDIAVIGLENPTYPLLLAETSSPPLVLFVRGNAALLRSRCVTVVGTRNMTRYGAIATQAIVEPLARSGITIVSGLAFGIDAASHAAALAAQGKTLAVLGSGIDVITPISNQGLGLRILKNNGAIVSEYPPQTPVQKHFFPQRNRILAGLSPATLVVEAGITSGALITAKMALEEGREVFAVPGPITAETSVGTNALLKSGASPVTASDDLSAALGLDMRAHVQENMQIGVHTATEMTLLSLLREPRHVDELVTMSTLDASVVSACLTLLELRGHVRHLGGMHYERTI